MRLKGKVAIITGGNSGIGLETAKLFVSEGARVLVTGRNEESLASAAKELGSQALVVRCDVSELSSLDDLTKLVRDTYGRIDILFANAGTANFVALPDVSEAYFDSMMNTNVKGAYFTVQRLTPLLNDHASVILTGSSLSLKGVMGGSVYSATKAAIRSLARSFTAELVERGIRVNVLSPGPIETPIFARMNLPPEKFDKLMQANVAKVPLKRMGRPDEIAKAALFLASDDSSFIAGAELFADGGVAQL